MVALGTLEINYLLRAALTSWMPKCLQSGRLHQNFSSADGPLSLHAGPTISQSVPLIDGILGRESGMNSGCEKECVALINWRETYGKLVKHDIH